MFNLVREVGRDSASTNHGSSLARIAMSAASVGTPSRRSVPGVLPDCAESLVMSHEVISELEGDTDVLTKSGKCLRWSVRRHRS